MNGRIKRLGSNVGMGLIALSIGLLAFAIKTASPTAASSGTTPVTLQDGATSNLAKVSKAGALSVDGSVGTYPQINAASALNLYTYGGNQRIAQDCPSPDGAIGGCYPEIVNPTQATIDITSLTVALDGENANSWDILLQMMTVPKGTAAGKCWDTASYHVGTSIYEFALHPGTTTTVSPASPIVLAPAPGQSVCLIAEGGNDPGEGSNNSGFYTISATGYVVSGSYDYNHNTNGNNTGNAVKPGARPGSPTPH
jgi:hypothetical protein